MPGGFPGGFPGGMPGGMPGGFPGGMPGGMPGAGGMGGAGGVDFNAILKDPELLQLFQVCVIFRHKFMHACYRHYKEYL